MGPLFLAAVVLLLVFLALAVFGRGGPTETLPTAGVAPEGLSRLSLAELGSVSERLFSELGLTTASRSVAADRIDLILEDPTPVTGQRVYVRCLLTPAAGAVESAEVQAALDTARHAQLTKAIVVTPGQFSDEARLVALDSSVELIAGPQLAELLRSHLADVANRLGIPR
jgi:hypothetical protein